MADPHEAEKAAAARAAVARVRPNMRLALGTGSTAAYAVRALADRFPNGDGITCVASSERTEALARELGIEVGPLRPTDRFELMIDGADEVDPSLSLTKGGGGALFREKFLARLSAQVVIVIDPTKLVPHLGTRSPIPVEVVPFARETLITELAKRSIPATVRTGAPRGGTFRTDNGLEVLDLRPPPPLPDAGRLDTALRAMPGVVETGLFVGLASSVLIGRSDGSVEERRPLPSH
jgi:ribose 5-phosphate isomerase A